MFSKPVGVSARPSKDYPRVRGITDATNTLMLSPFTAIKRRDRALSFAKTPPGGQVVDLSTPIRENPSSMITLLLRLLQRRGPRPHALKTIPPRLRRPPSGGAPDRPQRDQGDSGASRRRWRRRVALAGQGGHLRVLSCVASSALAKEPSGRSSLSALGSFPRRSWCLRPFVVRGGTGSTSRSGSPARLSSWRPMTFTQKLVRPMVAA